MSPGFLDAYAEELDWSSIRGLRVKGPDGKWRLRPPDDKPTEADLDAAEAALGVALPGSYRSFCTQVGPGILCDFYQIYAPPHLTEVATHHRDSWPRPGEPYAYDFPVHDLMAFAHSLEGDVFAFHPKEPTHGDEYAIYAVLRHPPPESMVARVAASFPDFIDNVALGHRMIDLGIFAFSFETNTLRRTWDPNRKKGRPVRRP